MLLTMIIRDLWGEVMGTKLDFVSRINITEQTTYTPWKSIGYRDLTDELISQIADDTKIKFIQISKPLPQQAYWSIDKILEKRDDIHFRIYGLYGDAEFDLSCLHLLKHLKHITLDAHLGKRQDMFNLDVLTELENLQTLRLALFDLRDYSFIKNLSSDIKELCISADTMSGGVAFDCAWLTRYKKLKTLYLGKKAKKHIERIAEIGCLENLTLRGIKLKDFKFLRESKLCSLSIHLCGMNDLTSLTNFDNLKILELWRIMKLEDISFISTLTSLEQLNLRDLSHITTLPDLSRLKNLQQVILDNVPIDVTMLPICLQKITHKYR